MMSKESKINEGLALLNEKNNYQPLTILMGDFNTNLLHVLTSTLDRHKQIILYISQ